MMKTQLRQFVASVTIFGMLTMQMPMIVSGQEAPPPPPTGDTSALAAQPQANLRTAAELDTLLAPIALYPDPLLAQILPAATAPSDIVLAHRYIQAQKDPAGIDQQPWNESVKALARYPDVIKMMDDKLDWTTELGQVYLAQPDDVFASVQNLRSQAAAVGNLKDTPQQVIVHEKETILIQPANPQVIYVPTYPTTIYTAPPPDPMVPLLAFGAGLAVGIWLNNDHNNYWYGRGNYYHGGGYHNGNYYGGNNSVNINNNNNVNIGNGNNNGNRPGNGGGNGQRPPGGGNGQRPPGNGNGAGNGNRPGNGGNNPQRPGAGNGAGNQRPGGGNGNGPGAGGNRPGAGNGGAGGGNNQRPGLGGGAGGGNNQRPGLGGGAGGSPQRPQTRPAGGAQQRPAGGTLQRPGSGGGGLFNRDASKPEQRGDGGRGAAAPQRGGGAGAARGGGGGGGAAPARAGGGGGGAARGGGGGGGGAARAGGGGGGGVRGGR